MRYRLFFLTVTAFFVTMNVLLWRAEFGARSRYGSPVPAETVWEKILTCPDNSWLEIRRKGTKIGRAIWSANIGEALSPSKVLNDELPPEGMIQHLASYTLDFDGQLSLDELSRPRFHCNLKLGTNQNWQELSLRITLKPFAWSLLASEALQSVTFSAEDDEGRTERVISFTDLQNPEKLLRDLGGATLPATLAAFGVRLPQPGRTNSLDVGLKWEARNDWLKVGRNPVRVYRLEARLFDLYRATLFVSPVGEILRVELPDEIVLVNDALVTL